MQIYCSLYLITPVSYTHLDVYKRQAGDIVRAAQTLNDMPNSSEEALGEVKVVGNGQY